MRFLSEKIAKVCHEANRAYCEVTGDFSQVPWERAPDWQKQSAVSGVEKIISGEIAGPGQAHESWLAEKKAAGWKHGDVKDPIAKTHPCFVEFSELPPEQQAKDYLFFAIVTAFTGHETPLTPPVASRR
jgi:hypothetical protein